MMTKKSEGGGSLDQLVTLGNTLKRQRAVIKYHPADASLHLSPRIPWPGHGPTSNGLSSLINLICILLSHA